MFMYIRKLLKNTLRTVIVMCSAFAFGLGPNNAFSQKDVVLVEEDTEISVYSMFELIREQTGYNFVFNDDLVSNAPPIEIKQGEILVQNLLEKGLAPLNCSFELTENKTVVVKRTKEKDLSPIKRGGIDQATIIGKVTDENGQPLIGATVFEKNTTTGTQTDIDGNFTLEISDSDAVIVISYVGFLTQEITLNGQDNLNVILYEDSALEEVVITGYGSKRKIAVTGAIGTIGTEQLQEIPAATVGQLLAGRTSGLYITQSGGKPGKSSVIRIRSASTFSGASATPLFVIDGIVSSQFAFDGLDISEIDNISILKDGASAAVYGSRAANGVIIVTTKRGKAGKPVINITASHGYEEPTVVPGTLDAYETATYENKRLEIQEQRQEGFVARENPGYYTQDEVDYFRENRWDLIDQTYTNPLTTKVALNVSGGSERVNYFVGGSFFNGTGTFDNLSFQRYNLRARVDANISDNRISFIES